MEQLGNIMTAMIAVIVGGSSGMMLEPEPVYSTHPELAGIDLKEFQRGGKYFGVYRRVANELGVSRPLVTYTARGKGARRVLDALLKEIHRVDQAPPAPHTAPLTESELSLFAKGRYRGAISRVASNLGMETSNVWRVAHGEKSERVLKALRAELARIDAELAAKKAGA